VLLLIMPLSGCYWLTGHDLRPELIVRGRSMRAAILNPEPPLYGDGNPGGCLIWSEFRVVITDVTADSTGALRIRGFVSRTEGIPLPGVQIAEERGGITSGVVYSGLTGDFEITAQPGDAAKLVVSRTWYRPLELDLSQLARARTATAS
jgi:hypothetical protein